jgi:putative chitinase
MDLQTFARCIGCTLMTAKGWHGPFERALQRWPVVDLPMLLAQVGHESTSLSRTEEGLNYSAQRLMAVWPSRFPTIEAAHYYEHAPERLANQVYGGRMGNGPYESGDGWRYRGRGPLQVTGRDNYERAGIALNLPLVEQPELLEEPEHGAAAAVWFFTDRGCDGKTLEAATRRINGGLHGLDDRRERYERAQRALGVVA